jgi:tRNA(Ile)-lysidine synthase
VDFQGLPGGRGDGRISRVPWDGTTPWIRTASRQQRWLVGVSGGADSVALLHLLVESGFRDLVVCHLNHQLRGEQAAADAAFVADLARSLGLTCEVGTADVAARIASTGESLETAARRARHEFFKTCAIRHRCRRWLLAHHADDQAETVLWNLLRGSHGLKGMRTEQKMCVDKVTLHLSRPLLEVRGADLREWLTARGLPWREDASNAVPDVIRNRLRLEIVPRLTEIAGRDAATMIGRALASCRDLEEIEQWAIAQARALDPQGRLHLPTLRSLPLPLQRAVLAHFLKQARIPQLDGDLITRALTLIDPTSPPAVNLPGGGALRRRAGRLLIERLS